MNKADLLVFDDDGIELYRRYKWHTDNRGYLRRRKGKTHVYFHREFLDPPKGYYVDHINNYKLDNRKVNLRICTPKQNTWNTFKKTKGVCRRPDKKWEAYIWDGKQIYLGRFATKAAALNARKKAVIKHRGKDWF